MENQKVLPKPNMEIIIKPHFDTYWVLSSDPALADPDPLLFVRLI